jgi:phage protein D/phage baseplate assembly protein gpV
MSNDNVNWPDITINGYPVDTSSEGYVEIVVVDDDVTMPASFAITFRSIGESDPIYKIGDIVEISPPGGLIEKPLVKGEITAISGDYDATGNRVHLRGYDISHRLHRGRKTRTFVNVTDSDIVRRVASAAGLDIGTLDQTTTTHDYVSQANQTDWDFLKSRAKAAGYLFYVDQGLLYFKKPTDSATAPGEGNLMETTEFTLVYGSDLIEWRPRLNSAEQVSQVEVRGWDRENKRELVSQAAAATTAAKLSDTSPISVAQPFGDATFVHAYHPGESSDELDAAAKVYANHIGSAFAEAEGLARGNGDLRPGTAVSISGVADLFSGQFVISRAKHTFSRNSYQTEFQINGAHSRSLLGLVAHAAPPVQSNGKIGSNSIYGVVPAIVTGNDDPEKQGRVKFKLPGMSGTYESNWAPMLQAAAGPNSGAVFLPEVDDEILVSFENGDIHKPFVIGGLYNGQDKPRLDDNLFDQGKVRRRSFVSRKGHRFIFFDADNASGVAIVTSNGKLQVSLNETSQELHIKGDMKVIVESDQEIDLKTKNLSLRADSDLTLRGGKVTIKADGVVDIDGAVIQLN